MPWNHPFWRPFVLFVLSGTWGLPPPRRRLTLFSSEQHTTSGNCEIWAGYIIAMGRMKKKQKTVALSLSATHSLADSLSAATLDHKTAKLENFQGHTRFLPPWGIFIYTACQTKEETNSAEDHKPLIMETQDTATHTWIGKPYKVLCLCVWVRKDFNVSWKSTIW